MTTKSTLNPRITEATSSMLETTRDIAAAVRPLSPALLAWRPSPEVWSILDNLAHIEEFVPFWIGEVQAMLQRPPALWGRDQTHAGRLEAVRDTAGRDVDQLLASIDARIDSACAYLLSLQDADLDVEAESRNPRWAIKPVSFVVDTLLVKHLRDHRQQIQRNLAQAAAGEKIVV